MNCEITIEEAKARYHAIPELILKGLYQYAEHRTPTGGFLRAVLTNDLAEAVGRADQDSLRALQMIVQFMYNEMPSPCWGSKEAVTNWLKKEKTT